MKSGFVSNLSVFFFSLAKALLLILLSLVSAFVIVFPFWFFAKENPAAYSIVIVSILFALAVFFIVLYFKNKLKVLGKEQKKVFLFNCARLFLLLKILLCSATIPVVLVLDGKRLASLIVLISGLIVFGVCVFAVKKK